MGLKQWEIYSLCFIRCFGKGGLPLSHYERTLCSLVWSQLLKSDVVSLKSVQLWQESWLQGRRLNANNISYYSWFYVNILKATSPFTFLRDITNISLCVGGRGEEQFQQIYMKSNNSKNYIWNHLFYTISFLINFNKG